MEFNAQELQDFVNACSEKDDVIGVGFMCNLYFPSQHVTLSGRLGFMYMELSDVEGVDKSLESVVGDEAGMMIWGIDDNFVMGYIQNV